MVPNPVSAYPLAGTFVIAVLDAAESQRVVANVMAAARVHAPHERA